MTKVRSVFLVLLLVTLQALATPAVIVEHYTTAEGLPSNNVMCALKDRDGFLWFGTWYGLTRFDGSRFLTYNKPVKGGPTIPPRKVESMVEDGLGRLWLKTVDWKLFVFDRQTERFHAVMAELKAYTKNLQIIKIQATDEGRVLLLTKDKNLLLAHSDSAGRLHIERLFDAHDHIDAATLQLRDDAVGETRNYLCFVGRDYRIFALPKKKIAKSSLAGGREVLLRAMAADSLHTDDLQRAAALAAEAGIDKYAHLYTDRDSLLWVSTTANGIYRVSRPPHSFRLLPLPDQNPTGVRCLYQTRQGNVLVGTRSRDVYLYSADGTCLQTFSYAQYGIGAVYHATEDARGRLWLSTKGDGLVLVTPDATQPSGYRLAHYRHVTDDPQSLSGNSVYMTFIDSQQHVWVCTLDGGLNLVEERADGQLRFYHKHNGFKHYPAYGLYTEVRNIVEGRQGRLWVGTIDGLMSLDVRFAKPADIRFHTYRDQPDATYANNDIYTLYRDQQGFIWIGAFGGGLGRLAGNRLTDGTPSFLPLGPREGLHNDIIYSITESHDGRIWFATEAGLSCYDKQTERVRDFDRYDGLPAVEMEEASAVCCADGLLWMGCKQGILTFDPTRLTTRHAHYRTYILNLFIENHPYQDSTAMPFARHVRLKHDQNTFAVEFAALNYEAHGSLSYRYRLEGYDRDWHYSGPERRAAYTNVPPGSYTFTVETIDDDNPQLHSAATLTISILPPWWATWWAWLIYLTLAAMVAWLVIRTMLQMNRMRNEVYISRRLAQITTQQPTDTDEFIDRVHRLIRQNIANSDFNIDTFAAELGLSRSAFFKKVKSQTGFAPLDLIKEFRISHAAELIAGGQYSITEVAYRSGFKDVSYFGKCFRKRYGLSPREYVNQRKTAE